MSQEGYAQILTDRGKLKTVKSDGVGFALFARKIKTESAKKKKTRKRTVRARYSSNKGRVRKRNVNPGFSSPLFGGRVKGTSPRFSKKRFVASNPNAGTRFTPKKKRVRKSGPGAQPSEGRAVVQLAGGPRYSAKSKRNRKYAVSPRFSTGSKGAIQLAESPRYSNKPKRKKKFAVQPRFTQGGKGVVKLAESPRYSTNKRQKKKLVVSPRYSTGKDGVIAPYPVRYSEVSKDNKKVKVSPRYSNTSNRNVKIIYKPGFNVFDYLLAIPGGVILAVRPHNEDLALFKGWLKKKDVDKRETGNSKFQGHAKTNIKIIKNYKNKRRAKSLLTYSGDYRRKTAFFEKIYKKKRSNAYSDIVVPSGYNKRRKNMHPSAVNLTVKRASSKTGKSAIKKISEFWSKVDGNKTQPPSVRGRSKKLKFDKKEKGLWYE